MKKTAVSKSVKITKEKAQNYFIDCYTQLMNTSIMTKFMGVFAMVFASAPMCAFADGETNSHLTGIISAVAGIGAGIIGVIMIILLVKHTAGWISGQGSVGKMIADVAVLILAIALVILAGSGALTNIFSGAAGGAAETAGEVANDVFGGGSK